MKIRKLMALALCTAVFSSFAAFGFGGKKDEAKKEATAPAKPAAVAQPAAAQPTAAPARVEDKLVPWITLEQAFANSVNTRNQIARNIVAQREALAKETDAAKKEAIQKQINAMTQNFTSMNFYLDQVFGLDNRREYVYNNVTSTIYLKVGTVRDSFLRAVLKRNILARRLTETDAAIAKETDAAKKTQLQQTRAQLANAHQIMQNALQVIYKIDPRRNYEFDNEKDMLYLKSNA